MSPPSVREVFEHHFEVIGKTEHKGRSYLLVKHNGGTAHRLLSTNFASDLDAQLGSNPGSIKALLQQAGDASSGELWITLTNIWRAALPVEPTRKAVNAYNILKRLHELQNEKEGSSVSARRRTEINNDYQRLYMSLRAVDAEPE